MKIAFNIVRIVLNTLFGLWLFLWLMYHASGHDIPFKTDLIFGITSLGWFVVVLIINFYMPKKIKLQPSEAAIKEALNTPGGWVYAIDETFDKDEDVPPQAIKGCWKVNEKGIIVGDFIPNPNYMDLTKLD